MDISKNMWRYSINEGVTGGVIWSLTYEGAMSDLKRMYADYDDEFPNGFNIIIWPLEEDDFYDKRFPSQLPHLIQHS